MRYGGFKMANELGNNEVMAANIQYYLSLHRMERKDLAECLNSKYTTVCGWLTAKSYPRIDKIEKMAQVFGIAKSDLVEKREIAKPVTDNDDGNLEQLIDAIQDLNLEELRQACDYVLLLKNARNPQNPQAPRD